MTLFGDRLFTPRLALRRVTNRDITLMVAWSNSESAHGKYLSPSRITEEIGLMQLEMGVLWADKNKTFIIERRDETPLGTIHYWLRPERKECAVLSIKISVPEARNMGYGTEAQKYLIINLFQRMKIKEIEMYTDIDNKAQQRCLEKLGFRLVESLTYDDFQTNRLGHLFRLESARYQHYPIYQYIYE